jgi:hypothetical protein
MMVPKQRSQMACGIPHSAADHWFATLAGKSSVGIPRGATVKLEEGSEDEFFFSWGNVKEERVIVEATAEAEVLPPAPDAIGGLVAGFLLRVKDNSTVCNTCMTQDKISLGSGEMSKLGGICEEREA